MSRLEQLEKLATMTPDDPLGHYGLALEYLNLERWDDAVGSFARTIEIDAKYTAAYYHKARAEIRAGLADAARDSLTKGVAVAQSAGDWKTRDEMRELLESVV